MVLPASLGEPPRPGFLRPGPPGPRPGPPINVEDSVPRSFGPGVLNSQNEYIVDNLIKLGDQMPANQVKTYYTPVDNMSQIVLRAFENMSTQNSVVPCVDRTGAEQPCNAADMVKLLGELTLALPPRTPRTSPIEVTFRVDASGVYIKAVNVSTGEAVDATLSMQSDVDMDNSAATTVQISGE